MAGRPTFQGMRTRFAVAAHLSADELAARYRAAGDPVRRSQVQMIWLLVAGRPLAEVAEGTGYSTRWQRRRRRSVPGRARGGCRSHRGA